MKELSVEKQNAAVYVQECLGILQEPDDGVRHFLSRFKGVALHCHFAVNCTCKQKVSYAEFELVSGLVDTQIKEDIFEGEKKTL